MTVQRLVVWIQVAGDRGWELPPAIPRNGVGWGHGARRDLHELAVAIASLEAVLAVETPGELSAADLLGVEVVA